MNKKQSISEIKKYFEENRDPSTSALALRLIDELVYTEKLLTKLKKDLSSSAPVTEFKQGSQQFSRVNPALKAYQTTVKSYQSILKQLHAMLPTPGEVYPGEFEL